MIQGPPDQTPLQDLTPSGLRRLSRSSPLADARARLHRLRRQLHDKRIGIQRVAAQHGLQSDTKRENEATFFRAIHK
jgi:hypothetical protein